MLRNVLTTRNPQLLLIQWQMIEKNVIILTLTLRKQSPPTSSISFSTTYARLNINGSTHNNNYYHNRFVFNAIQSSDKSPLLATPNPSTPPLVSDKYLALIIG